MDYYTKQYAKLGQTTYDVTRSGWTDDEPFTIDTFEAPDLGAAISWLESQPKTVEGAEVVDITIYRGTYEEDSGLVAGYGFVHDASWRQDDRWSANCWFEDDVLRWDVSEW